MVTKILLEKVKFGPATNQKTKKNFLILYDVEWKLNYFTPRIWGALLLPWIFYFYFSLALSAHHRLLIPFHLN